MSVGCRAYSISILTCALFQTVDFYCYYFYVYMRFTYENMSVENARTMRKTISAMRAYSIDDGQNTSGLFIFDTRAIRTRACIERVFFLCTTTVYFGTRKPLKTVRQRRTEGSRESDRSEHIVWND